MLDRYIEQERGNESGALFLSNRSNRLSRQKANDALNLIEAQANAHLPPSEHIHVSPHKLRHTHLRDLTEKYGMQYAKEESGHASFEHLHRYVKPRPEEREAALESLHG